MSLFYSNFGPIIFITLLLHFNHIFSIPVENILQKGYTAKWYQEKDPKMMFFELFVSIENLDSSTGSYVGFGISNSGTMGGADFAVFTLLENGKIILEDMHGVGNMMPKLDKNQNLNLIDFKKNENGLWVKFSRKINSCDGKEDVKISDNTQYILWSFGKLKDNKINYHGKNRGAKAVNFLDPVFEKFNSSKYKTYPMHQDIVLTSDRTLYWCKFHKVPKMEKKTHIVGYAMNVNDGLAKFHAHHSSILSCTPPDGVNPDNFFAKFLNPQGYDCYFSSEKPPVDNCKHFDFQWAYGGEETMFPQNVGVPFGENTEYYMTMTHIDNPEQNPGIKFRAGLDLYITENLRPLEAGFFQIGINSTKAFSLTVPPNSTNYLLSSHCPSKCTQDLPKDGINVFVYLLHFHLTGRKMKVRHFRGESELPWIANDENYDTNYQNNRLLKKHVKVLPGDHLTVECTYNSMDRNGDVVIGGRGLLDEMCQAFLMYYPKSSSINRCGSGYPQDQMLDFMKIQKIDLAPGENNPTVLEPAIFNGKNYTQVVKEAVNWTNIQKRWEFELLTKYGYHEAECTGIGKGVTILTKYPQTNSEYAPYDDCKVENSEEVKKNRGRVLESSTFLCFLIIVTAKLLL